MAIDILTKEDLNKFKVELFEELRSILKSRGNASNQKEWLKSYEVRKILGISPGTLQNMRVNGTIAFTQIGGLMFYKYEDIIRLMEENKFKHPLVARDGKR